jgi:uncharacterized protein YidB (DUF937 family)
MSLLDMAGELMGGQQNAGAGSSSALSAVLAMVNNHPGGLPGLISAFEQNGLGGVANSWVSPGTPNQPVTGGQVQSVIGGNQLQEAASGVVAQLLPSIVDHLTPNGQVPASGANLMELGEGMLKNFLK